MSPGHCRILLRRGIHPLNPDECDVYTTLVDEAQEARIAAMSNHHVTADGEIEGFRFTCSGTSMARSLPISRKMFFAYSMVECTQCTDGHKGGLGQSILGLLMKQNSVKKSLQRLVGSIHAESVGSEASFECMPEDVDVVENDPRAMYTGRAAADCREWKPEIPEFVGLYHAYVKGFNKETRAHRLFLITSGGCSSMCDNYFNLSVDVRNDMSCQEVPHTHTHTHTR